MLKKLRYLFADDNLLQQLPDAICSCNNLTVLSISKNRVKELPSNIGQISALKVLNIVGNCISTLPVSLLQLRQLTSLWISDNQSKPLVPLQYIHINNENKLTCFMLPQSDIDMSSNTFETNTNNKTTCMSIQNKINSYRRYQIPTSYQFSIGLKTEYSIKKYKAQSLMSYPLEIIKPQREI